MSVLGQEKVKTDFQYVYPTWEKRKNISEIIQNMSDIIRNMSDIFFPRENPFENRPKNADKNGRSIPFCTFYLIRILCFVPKIVISYSVFELTPL